MQRILPAVLLFAVAACAGSGMDEAECRATDWRAAGFEDGARGRGPENFGRFRKACAGHGVTADFDAYLAGHGEGLARFCRPQNGYRLGSGGYRYNGVCPAHLEPLFLEAHADGYGLYQRNATLNQIGKQLANSRARAKSIEYELVEKSTRLVSPLMLPADRAAIVVELKQLTEEKVEVEQSIERLEQDYAAAERDYQHYRSRIAGRHQG